MIEVWRLVRSAFCPSPRVAFSGEGAAIAGGRWNRRGTRVAYASQTRSLAILEILATIDRVDAPSDYVFVSATLEEGEIERLTTLPATWRAPARSDSSIDIGETFLTELKHLALAVPSAIVPQEYNYLINPRHPAFESLRVAENLEPFSFDARIFTKPLSY
ncbi:MAG: RES family NAD+ phosphorylase [Candidatus Cybelea sp.]